jgi:hypothetical protein
MAVAVGIRVLAGGNFFDDVSISDSFWPNMRTIGLVRPIDPPIILQRSWSATFIRIPFSTFKNQAEEIISTMRVFNSTGTNKEMTTNRRMTRMLGLLQLLLIFANSTAAFVSLQPSGRRIDVSLGAAPKRLDDNVEGPLYVNEKVSQRSPMFFRGVMIMRLAKSLFSSVSIVPLVACLPLPSFLVPKMHISSIGNPKRPKRLNKLERPYPPAQ